MGCRRSPRTRTRSPIRLCHYLAVEYTSLGLAFALYLSEIGILKTRKAKRVGEVPHPDHHLTRPLPTGNKRFGDTKVPTTRDWLFFGINIMLILPIFVAITFLGSGSLQSGDEVDSSSPSAWDVSLQMQLVNYLYDRRPECRCGSNSKPIIPANVDKSFPPALSTSLADDLNADIGAEILQAELRGPGIMNTITKIVDDLGECHVPAKNQGQYLPWDKGNYPWGDRYPHFEFSEDVGRGKLVLHILRYFKRNPATPSSILGTNAIGFHLMHGKLLVRRELAGCHSGFVCFSKTEDAARYVYWIGLGREETKSYEEQAKPQGYTGPVTRSMGKNKGL